MSQVIATTEVTQEEAGQLADRISANAHWALRIALAGVFLYHGADKLGSLGMFAQMMNLPVAIAWSVALAEFVGGALILTGGLTRDWVTRTGAALFVPIMLGAISMVHWGQWNFLPSNTHPMGGVEFQVTLLLISLYFVIKGNRA